MVINISINKAFSTYDFQKLFNEISLLLMFSHSHKCVQVKIMNFADCHEQREQTFSLKSTN